MAVNPMQRKANNSFLLGILITLLITGVIIALLLMQLGKINKEKREEEAQKVQIYVLTADVKSGEIITGDSFKQIAVTKNTVPANAITSSADLDNYGLCDSQGRSIVVEDEVFKLVISSQETPELIFDDTVDKYYYEKSNTAEKVYIELDSKSIIAKVDLSANTILTTSTIATGSLLASDIRKQEYNIITLPTQLQTGEYVDIRLRLPNGQDYIVVSHKQVTIPTINGVDSQNCVWVDLSEVEILNMSSAIVEAYRMNGAKIYATRYVEAGMQEAATVTYIPSGDVLALMLEDPNAVQEAKNNLYARYQDQNESKVIRDKINSAKNNEDADDNLQEGVTGEIQGLQEEREKYLESLGL